MCHLWLLYHATLEEMRISDPDHGPPLPAALYFGVYIKYIKIIIIGVSKYPRRRFGTKVNR